MPLPAPNLDDRTFQELVDECKRLIPRYCPEWTDHNVSDPGIALIELFSWLVEGMTYRLNQVPDKNYVKFMDLLGIKLQPPSPARAELAFWLVSPLVAQQATPVTIPAQTETGTVRTETTEALIFSTEHDLTMVPPTLSAFQGHPIGHPPRQHLQDLRSPRIVGQGVHIFSDYPSQLERPPSYQPDFDVPQPEDAFYLGFDEDLARNILNLHLECREAVNRGINPSDPPLQWQAWQGERFGWINLEMARDDSTGGLTGTGDISLYLPNGLASGYFGGQEARTWVRAIITPSKPGQGAFSRSPEIISMAVSTIGGTAVSSHSQAVVNEEIGISDGTPGQIFQLRNAPVLARQPGEYIQVEDEYGDAIPWQEIDSFWPVDAACPTCGQPHPRASQNGVSPSHPIDRWYQLDDMEGIITFGPLVREPDGGARQCGAVPPKGRRIRMSRYRHGGGSAGNVGPNTIVVLKQAHPLLAPEVTNRRPATGGADAETVDRAKLRTPNAIRTRDRAVTADDFELLARNASSSVARVKCLQAGPMRTAEAPTAGQVTVLLVPEVPDASGPLEANRLRLDPSVRATVLRYLDERRLLTTTLVVDDAPVIGVVVEANVQIAPTADPERVRAAIERQLYRFLHPTQGWTDGRGWPFGRDLIVYDLYAVMQPIPGVLFIATVRIYPVQPDGTRGMPSDRVAVPAGAVIFSGRHTITVERAEMASALAWGAEGT